MFENQNFTDFLIKNSDLSIAENSIITMIFKNGKTINEVSDMRGITTKRVKKFIKSGLTKIKNFYESVNTNQHLHDRAEFGYRVAEESAANDSARKLFKMKNSNNYYV